MRARPAAIAAAVLLATAADPLLAADPTVSLVTPRGARRGAEVTFTVQGDRLADAAEVLFYEPGFAVTKIEPDEKRGDKLVRVTATVAPDARLGEHLVQLRTASGLSEFVTVYVGALPELEEAEPNSDPAAPQVLNAAVFSEAGGVTLTGKIDNEDLDHFALDLAEGEVVSVEVEGIRLGSDFNNAFDPAVEILDADGRERAAADDHPLTAADPVLHFAAPAAGTYTIRLRHSEYRGSGRSYYRMHVGAGENRFPRPLAAFPPGGRPGEPTEITFLGDPAGPFTQTVTLTEGPDGLARVVPERGGVPAPSAVPLRVADLPAVAEVEPNPGRDGATAGPGVAEYRAAVAAAEDKAKADAKDPADQKAVAEAVEKAAGAVTPASFAGAAFHGILEQPGDEDWFAFAARKGQRLRFEAFGRRIGSGADLELNFFDASGKPIKGVSDDVGLDPRADETVPADGVYMVRVRDHLGRGGPLLTYRLEVAPPVGRPTLSVPRHGRYGQARQRIAVPRGGHFATQVTVSRDGLGGVLAVDADRLPAGVTLDSPPVPGDQATWPALFTAAGDAPLGGTISNVRAFPAETPADLAANLKRRAAEQFALGGLLAPADRSRFAATGIAADFVRYRNNEMLWGATAPGLAVAVVEKLPFSVEVLPPTAPLVRDGTLELQIKVHRDEGFDGQVVLEFPHRTAGVGCDYQRKVPGDQDTAVYPLNANGKAATGDFPFYVLATAALPGELNGIKYGGGTGTCCSELVAVAVAETPFTLKLAKGAVRRTESAAIAATLQNADFQGTATVTLKGLPDGLTCEPVAVTSDQEAFNFVVAAADEAPTGDRKGLIAEVTLSVSAEAGGAGTVTFNAGTTDLRVDAAPKQPEPKTEPAPQQVAAAEQKPAPPEPLSRLERLRREAAAGSENTAADAPAGADDK